MIYGIMRGEETKMVEGVGRDEKLKARKFVVKGSGGKAKVRNS